jgi:hypothetical protein
MPAALLLVAVMTAAAAPAPARATWRTSGAAYVRGLVRAPKRLLERVDPARGLVVVRSLTCEREKPVKAFTRACGADVDRAAAPVLAALVGQLRMDKVVGDGRGVRCKPTPRATCTVPPTSECEPEVTLVFAEPSDTAPVIAIVERDDWQSQDFYRAKTNRRIETLLARQADACGQAAGPSP